MDHESFLRSIVRCPDGVSVMAEDTRDAKGHRWFGLFHLSLGMLFGSYVFIKVLLGAEKLGGQQRSHPHCLFHSLPQMVLCLFLKAKRSSRTPGVFCFCRWPSLGMVEMLGMWRCWNAGDAGILGMLGCQDAGMKGCWGCWNSGMLEILGCCMVGCRDARDALPGVQATHAQGCLNTAATNTSLTASHPVAPQQEEWPKTIWHLLIIESSTQNKKTY